MSNPYPLAEEIKRFVDNPDAWQWQEILYSGWPAVVTESYHNVSFVEAMGIHRRGGQVRLIPKRSLIPSDRLPEGWEVERTDNPDWPYCVRRKGRADNTLARVEAMCELIRHIDPETSDE